VLSVITSTQDIDVPWPVRAGELGRGSYVCLEVTDTGVGMDTETVNRIFEPFFTTKEIDTGTGLGLSTVYGIVQHANGALDVRSDTGVGSTFRVYLPVSSGAPAPHQPVQKPSERFRGTETILLIERDSHVLSVLGRALRSAGYQVIGVSNPGEAILVVEEAQTAIHLLVSDAVMPHIDGIRLAERVGAAQPGLKVVLLSGYPEQLPDTLPEGLSVEFLQKPFEPGDFLRRVRSLLDS
jgi:CheY-like chemotaxis protein